MNCNIAIIYAESSSRELDSVDWERVNAALQSGTPLDCSGLFEYQEEPDGPASEFEGDPDYEA